MDQCHRMGCSQSMAKVTNSCDSIIRISQPLLTSQKLLPALIDPNKYIYDLKEAEALGLYVNKRDYVNYGYRANPNMTVRYSLLSVFMYHCETGNIWSHFLPALYFAY